MLQQMTSFPCFLQLSNIPLSVCATTSWASQGAPIVRNTPANLGATGDAGLIPGLGGSPGRRARQPAPVFLPGEPHGQRSLAGCHPWAHRESDTAEVTERAVHTHIFHVWACSSTAASTKSQAFRSAHMASGVTPGKPANLPGAHMKSTSSCNTLSVVPGP